MKKEFPDLREYVEFCKQDIETAKQHVVLCRRVYRNADARLKRLEKKYSK